MIYFYREDFWENKFAIIISNEKIILFLMKREIKNVNINFN